MNDQSVHEEVGTNTSVEMSKVNPLVFLELEGLVEEDDWPIAVFSVDNPGGQIFVWVDAFQKTLFQWPMKEGRVLAISEWADGWEVEGGHIRINFGRGRIYVGPREIIRGKEIIRAKREDILSPSGKDLTLDFEPVSYREYGEGADETWMDFVRW